MERGGKAVSKADEKKSARTQPKRITLGRNDPFLRGELFNAAKSGKVSTLDALLQNELGTPRVPVNSVDGSDGMEGLGWNALHHLCSSSPWTKEEFMDMDPDDPIDHVGCLRMLCDWGIQVDLQDQFGRTPLHIAVLSNRLPLVKRLLFQGASLEILTSDKKSAIDLAREKGFKNIEQTLIDRQLHLVTIAAKAAEKKKEKEKKEGFSFLGCCAAARD